MSRKDLYVFTEDPLEVQPIIPVKTSSTRKLSTSYCPQNEFTPLLQPSVSLPTVIGYESCVDESKQTPFIATRSEIGPRENDQKKKKRRPRFNTLSTATRKGRLRPLIISPFMPITTQISIDGSKTHQTKVKNNYEAISEACDPKLLNSSEDDTSDEESEISEDQHDTPFFKSFITLSSRQWLTISMLSLANLCSTIAFSCIAPFYPSEAKLKNLSETQTGIVFGVFEFTMFIISPLFGKYIIAIQARRMFIVGIAVTGITAILFGFLNYLPAGHYFFWFSVIVRILEAVGDAAFVTSSFAIAAKSFPRNIGFVVGVLETFAGLGYTAGPVIGGFFYDLGGFQLPFLVLGGVLLVATILAAFLVENLNDHQQDSGNKGMVDILALPTIWIPISSVVSCAISLSFLDPTLSNHLESFNLTPTEVGLMFLLCGGFYTLMSFVFGAVMDKYHNGDFLILFGSLATMLSMLFIGPTPLFSSFISKDILVIGISLAALGLAASALYIPCFQMCLDEVKLQGFDDNFHTYGCVSGIFQAAFGFGSFIGPTLGSVVVEKLGFAWTTTGIAILHVLLNIQSSASRTLKESIKLPNIIPWEYGSNQFASQKGIPSFGTARNIKMNMYDTSKKTYFQKSGKKTDSTEQFDKSTTGMIQKSTEPNAPRFVSSTSNGGHDGFMTKQQYMSWIGGQLTVQ